MDKNIFKDKQTRAKYGEEAPKRKNVNKKFLSQNTLRSLRELTENRDYIIIWN